MNELQNEINLAKQALAIGEITRDEYNVIIQSLRERFTISFKSAGATRKR